MTNAHLISAAHAVAATIDNIDGSLWGNLTCSEADTFADLLLAVGNEDAAASLIFQHSHADTDADGDDHAEIGEAARAQADVRGIEWRERDGYVLALEYVRELV